MVWWRGEEKEGRAGCFRGVRDTLEMGNVVERCCWVFGDCLVFGR